MGKQKKRDQISTVIGPDVYIKGEVCSLGTVHVEGRVEGNVVSHGDVLIGEQAVLKASLKGKRIIINGEVHGDVEAVQGVKINATGKVFGKITGDRLYIEEGGIYKGEVNMDVIASQNTFEGNYEFKPLNA